MTIRDDNDVLVALARALLARSDGPPRPLSSVLGEHPAAAAQLTDALLAAGLEPAPPSELSAPQPAPGERRIGAYRLIHEMGRGGQAVVFEAVDTRLGRRVALKILQADAFRSAFSEQRFRGEAATTSRLDHPGICPIYEVGEDGDYLFLAMRLVEGKTLAVRIQEARQRTTAGQPLCLATADQPSSDGHASEPGARHLRPWLPTLRLFETIGSALHAAHQAGITHRDVKPGNIMVQPDGSGVLLDFGLAADAMRTGEALTRTGDVFGTPAYMAPEQCRAEPTDHRTDVFALGATWFEALTGERAFPAETAEATIRAILAGRAPDPRRIIKELPRELAVIAGKAMDPDPRRRYQTAQAFADDLRRVRELRPILAVPPSTLLRVRRWVQRNPWLVAMAAVLAVAAASVFWSMREASVADRDRQRLMVRQELVALNEEVPRLQPVGAHHAAAVAWLDRADRLLEQGPTIRALLTELRSRGRAAADGALEVGAREHQAELERLDAVEQSLAMGLGPVRALADTRALAEERARQRVELRARIETYVKWTFADAGTQLLYDSMVQLLADLEAFDRPRGPRATMALELARPTPNAAAAPSWEQAIADIASSERYGGLRLRPQHGLQPLRKNPHTGLWEFAHLRSGPPPRLTADANLEFADDTGIVLVLLPGGRCTLGLQDADPTRPRYQKPLRGTEEYLVEIVLDPFFMAAHEGTQAQWRSLSNETNPSWNIPGQNGVTRRCPVEQVPWDQVTEVLARSGLCLPTEAQWEYAARGSEHRDNEIRIDGTSPALPDNLYDAVAWSAQITSIHAHLTGSDGFAATAPVGSFPANGFGFYDMRGNVQEWCRDSAAYPDRDLLRPGTGEWLSAASNQHGIRGSSYLANLNVSPISARTINGGHAKDRGFRAARRVDR